MPTVYWRTVKVRGAASLRRAQARSSLFRRSSVSPSLSSPTAPTASSAPRRGDSQLCDCTSLRGNKKYAALVNCPYARDERPPAGNASRRGAGVVSAKENETQACGFIWFSGLHEYHDRERVCN